MGAVPLVGRASTDLSLPLRDSRRSPYVQCFSALNLSRMYRRDVLVSRYAFTFKYAFREQDQCLTLLVSHVVRLDAT